MPSLNKIEVSDPGDNEKGVGLWSRSSTLYSLCYDTSSCMDLPHLGYVKDLYWLGENSNGVLIKTPQRLSSPRHCTYKVKERN